MQNEFKAFPRTLAVKLLVICLTYLAPIGYGTSDYFGMQRAYSQESVNESIPAGWESYFDRPDILKIKAHSNFNLGKSWDSLKAAHFSFVAEVLAIYPADTEIYFLARDSELLYDVARLVSEGTLDLNRIHLLNVSRANMRDKNIKKYLSQSGISEKLLEVGKKVLFIDTGFAGTIPRVIAENFSDKAKAQLKTHLVVSANPDHPSSRAFLVYLNPSVNEQRPSLMHSSIISYEHMFRYTDRSSRYVFSGNRYHPVSPKGKSSDGSVSKGKSLEFMQDLKASWLKPEVQLRFQAEKHQFEQIKNILTAENENEIIALKNVLGKHKDTPEGRIFEAQVRDILEAQKNTDLKVAIKLEDLGLSDPGVSLQDYNSKKNDFIKKYPEWAPILENPVDMIPKLFTEKNWQMIGNLLDANVDSEINGLLLKSLFDGPATEFKKDLQVLIIEKEDPATRHYLASSIFSQPHTKDMTDLLKLLLEKADTQTLQILAANTFSQPHTKEMTDLLKLLIEKGDAETLHVLAIDTFSKPHTKDMTELLKLLIEKGDAETLRFLASHTFSQPHTKEMKDLLKLLIEKGDAGTLQNLASFTFSQPHTKEMTELLRLLIEKGDIETLNYLASDTFSQPHTKEMTELLTLLVEKGSAQTLSRLARFTFTKAHAHTPTHLVLKKSLETANRQARKTFIEAELMKINMPIVLKPISSNLKPGDFIQIKDRMMKVIKKAGEGRRGIVFQVQSENGAFYALKTAKSGDPENLESLAKESAKALQWQALKIPHSKVLLQEKDYVLKTWIEGIRGDEVIEKYLAGDINYKLSAEYLLKLVAKIQAQGAYVGDFRPANLIWIGKAWVIIDSGSIQQGMTLAEAQSKWSSADARGLKFERRWKIPVPALSPVMCSKLFKSAG
ncbi:MAG: hypothetical protein H7235_12410 [Bdellovibrionaceae bacterium]|nr:hypothetical protein [Pseudobdellovibrionaceae bacterium]